MSGRDPEDFGAEILSEKSRMIPGLPLYDMDDQLLPREPRSPWCCLAWTLVIGTMNSLVFLLNLLLMFVIFTIVLLPTIVVVYFGFQCHSQVLHSSARYCKSILDDNSSSALIILGFVIMAPLLVVAMAIYCSLARHLQLLVCFQPYSLALYKGGHWCCVRGCNTQLKAWV
ncbi:transmembrane protein 88B [Cyanistes caeruleus]|uniref:transmembrane protein 88B n=1 Tax=Cyanistes caeruleus TaxID=156563 RepID=UPI000CDA6C37|nr:transmembrane protein 88B [Cyanistes caeruleus]